MQTPDQVKAINLCHEDQMLLEEHIEKWKPRLNKICEDSTQRRQFLESAIREMQLLLALRRTRDEAEQTRLKHLLFEELKPHFRYLAEEFSRKNQQNHEFTMGTQVAQSAMSDVGHFDEVTEDLMSRAYEHFDRVWEKFNPHRQDVHGKQIFVMVRTWFQTVIRNKFLDAVKPKSSEIHLANRSAPDRDRGHRRSPQDQSTQEEQGETQVAFNEYYNRIDQEERDWRLEQVDRTLAWLEAEGHFQPLEIKAFRCHALEDKTYQKTSVIVSKSIGWVHKRKERIETKLKTLLGRKASHPQGSETLAA